MSPRSMRVSGLWVACAMWASGSGLVFGQKPMPALASASGLRLVVDRENAQPVLRVLLPGSQEDDRTVAILFPEHVTARRQGRADAEQLYLFRAGAAEAQPLWRQRGQALEYDRTLQGGVHLLARATLDDDGVRLRYEFDNPSGAAFDMITAVTDPRLTGRFHDVRLERTYVHHPNGFDLLASETPNRLSMPLAEWLPARYLVSFTWPVPAERVVRRDDGITYYDKSRAVDEAFIATLSMDRQWVVASFAREAGNVWSNPELTCQHVDPQVRLGPHADAVAEMKILVIRGSVADAHDRAARQRASLK